MNYKLPPSYRLLQPDGYNKVIGSACIANRNYKIFFSKNMFCHGRLGVIVSSRMIPRAVDRNRIKRNIRESFRKHPIKDCGLDIVVVAKSGFDKLVANEGILVDLLTKVNHRCTELSLS